MADRLRVSFVNVTNCYVIGVSYGYLYFRAVWGKPRKKKGFGRFCPKEFIKCHPCLKYDAINKFYFHGMLFNFFKDTQNEVKSISTPCSDMTLTGLCQLELTKNLGPLCIAIGMLIIICSLGTADKRIRKSVEPMTWPKMT